METPEEKKEAKKEETASPSAMDSLKDKVKDYKEKIPVKNALLILGIVVALVFSIAAYFKTQTVSAKAGDIEQKILVLSETGKISELLDKIKTLEKSLTELSHTQDLLSTRTEELNKKVLVSDKTMTFLEEFAESLSKIMKKSGDAVEKK